VTTHPSGPLRPPVTMNSLWPLKATNDAADGSKAPVDVADTGVAADAPARPGMQRNQSQTAPNQPPDSLSLAQLRRIVSEFPRTEATVAYDFTYSDTGPHTEEIDEWFDYQFWQWVRLNTTQRAFESGWEYEIGAKNSDTTWEDATDEIRSEFVLVALDKIKSSDDAARSQAVGVIAYLVCGRWLETAIAPPFGDKSNLRSAAKPGQLDAMRSAVIQVAELGGFPIIWAALQNAFETLWYAFSAVCDCLGY
jgi:hypothetical protein